MRPDLPPVAHLDARTANALGIPPTGVSARRSRAGEDANPQLDRTPLEERARRLGAVIESRMRRTAGSTRRASWRDRLLPRPSRARPAQLRSAAGGSAAVRGPPETGSTDGSNASSGLRLPRDLTESLTWSRSYSRPASTALSGTVPALTAWCHRRRRCALTGATAAAALTWWLPTGAGASPGPPAWH